MVLGGTVEEWLTLLQLVLGPGLISTTLSLPILVSSRLRVLFRALPPTGSVVVSFYLVGMGLSVPWLIGLGWAFSRLGAAPETGAGGELLFAVAAQVGLLYIVVLPVLAVAGLPRLGIDWDPNEYSKGTWFILAAGAAWYVLIYAVPTVLFGVIISIPT